MLQYYINVPEVENGGSALSAADALVSWDVRAGERRDGFFPLVLALSLALHTVMAAAFLISGSQSAGGDGATELDVVSITIVSAADLQLASSANTATPTEVVEAVRDESSPVEQNDTVATKVESPDHETVEQASPFEAPSLAIADPTEVATVPEVQVKPKEAEEKKQTEEKTDKSNQAASPSQTGGATSAGPSIGGSTSGEGSASLGTIDRYAREVALVVARNRPRGFGTKGRVTVEFTVSASSQSAESVKIVKPSGNRKLDTLATSVIGKLRFPSVPSGMTPAQLTYRVPFVFE